MGGSAKIFLQVSRRTECGKEALKRRRQAEKKAKACHNDREVSMSQSRRSKHEEKREC